MAASNWQTLLAYVMKFGPLSLQGAEQWLDSHCPEWRSGNDVTAGQIWVETVERDHDSEQ
ncbi:MAG: hypothetical protein RR721_07975 [Aeromonas sp.]|uniref:hypothetical protein n=1 Tax=Aeromonas sp. TaxID=647 RepID=UPI002FCA994E